MDVLLKKSFSDCDDDTVVNKVVPALVDAEDLIVIAKSKD